MGNWWSLMGKYHLGNDFATSWSHYKSVLPWGSWRAYNPTPTRRSLKHCGAVALGRCQKSSSGPTASFFLGLLWWNPNYTLGNRPCSLNIWFDHGEPRGHWECWAAANSWLPMKEGHYCLSSATPGFLAPCFSSALSSGNYKSLALLCADSCSCSSNLQLCLLHFLPARAQHFRAVCGMDAKNLRHPVLKWLVESIIPRKLCAPPALMGASWFDRSGAVTGRV